MIFGDPVGLKLPDICLTGDEKPRKNLTQETCPDRGSNPGPLRDRRACYRLLHSVEMLRSIHTNKLFCDISCIQPRQPLLNMSIPMADVKCDAMSKLFLILPVWYWLSYAFFCLIVLSDCQNKTYKTIMEKYSPSCLYAICDKT